MKKLIKSLLILCMVTINISVPTFATAAPYEKFVIIKQGYTFENHRGGAIKISDQYGEKLAIVSDKEKVKYYNNGEENTSLTVNQQTKLKTVIAVNGEMVLTLEGQQIKKSRNYFWTLRDFNKDLIMAYVTRPAKQSFAINVTKFLKDIDRKTERLIIKKAKKLGLSYVDLKSALESSIDLDTAENNYDRAKLLAAAVNLDVKSVLKFKECQNHIIVNGVEICEDNGSSFTQSTNTSEGNSVVDNGGNDSILSDVPAGPIPQYIDTGEDFFIKYESETFLSSFGPSVAPKTFSQIDYNGALTQYNGLKGHIEAAPTYPNIIDKYEHNLNVATELVNRSNITTEQFDNFKNFEIPGFASHVFHEMPALLSIVNGSGNVAALGISSLTADQQQLLVDYLSHRQQLRYIEYKLGVVSDAETFLPQAASSISEYKLTAAEVTSKTAAIIADFDTTTVGSVTEVLTTSSSLSEINNAISEQLIGVEAYIDANLFNMAESRLDSWNVVENAGLALELAEAVAVEADITLAQIDQAKEQAEDFDRDSSDNDVNMLPGWEKDRLQDVADAQANLNKANELKSEIDNNDS